MKIKRLRLLLVGIGETLLFWLVAVSLTSFVLLFKLGSLTPGLSTPEIAHYNFSAIIHNPLNAPYRILSLGLNSFGHTNAFSLRLPSALVGFVTIWLFYYILSRWQDRRTAILGTLLFTTSAWFLHFARIAIPDISLTLLLAAVAYGIWIQKTKRSALAGILGVLLATGLVYTSGLIWFVVIGAIWQRKRIGSHIKEAKLSIPLIAALGVVLLAPLVVGISRQPSLIRPFLGMPVASLPTPLHFARNVIDIPAQIFFRGPNNPVIWLGRLPLLDIFASAVCLLGLLVYLKHLKLDRTKLLISVLVLGSLLIGLSGSVSIILLAPFIYLLAAAGLGFLLDQWLGVFPHNPLARFIGVSLIFIAVFLSCFYNLRHYFVAWPNTPATKRVYQRRI